MKLKLYSKIKLNNEIIIRLKNSTNYKNLKECENFKKILKNKPKK